MLENGVRKAKVGGYHWEGCKNNIKQIPNEMKCTHEEK